MKAQAGESKEEIGKMKAQIQGGKGCETKLKEAEDVISNLKVKIEEGKSIEDCLNTKLNDKATECSKLEDKIHYEKRDGKRKRKFTRD